MTDQQPLRIGIIGGSGVEEALGIEGGEAVTPDTPFGPPASAITLTQWEGVDIAVLKRHGDGHVFNPSRVPYRANIYAMKSVGVTHIVATGATGSLKENVHPGELMVIDQVIDKTYKRANTFFEGAAVHVELAEPFCPVMRQWLIHAARNLDDMTVHESGTYVCMEGPAFSTRAESNMHRNWGGDLIGMTVMPEAKLAREAEIAYAMVALPTDYDCWRPHDPNVGQMDLLSEIIGNLKKASGNSMALIKAALRDVNRLKQGVSPAHSALALAIWSHKDKIPADEVKRLELLWGEYFQ